MDDLQKFLPEDVDSDDGNAPDKTTLRYREMKDHLGEAYSESEDGDKNSDISEDDKLTRIDKMARDMETFDKQQKIYKMLKTAKAEK